MNKILRSIFKIWNFFPVSNAFLWLNKTPTQSNSPLIVQEGFRYEFWKGLYQFKNPIKNKILNWNTSLNTNWKTIFLKLVVVWSFCFGLILSLPLAWITKNGYLWVKYKPFDFLPNGNQINMSEDYTRVENYAEYRQRVDNTDGVEWKRRLCRILHFPFNSMTKHENILENTLVIDIKEIWSKDISN
jgi:hypothetical protein